MGGELTGNLPARFDRTVGEERQGRWRRPATASRISTSSRASTDPPASRTINAVLVDEEDWRVIQETLFLESVPGLAKSIRRARVEGIEAGSTELDW